MTSENLQTSIVVDELSKKIRPQDDLFRHANQSWMESTPIPADKSSYGSFMMLFEEAERAIRTIIEEAQDAPAGSERRKFGDLYASFLDEARIEELGATPLSSHLERADRVSTVGDLLRTIGETSHEGVAGFYQLVVDTDRANPDRYLVFLEQGGLSLPDESYYREEHFADVRAAFVKHVARMFELVGLDDTSARAERVLGLETEIAKRHWDNVATRDSEKTFNVFEWHGAVALFSERLAATPGEEAPTLSDWSSSLNLPPHAFDEVVLCEPSFTEEIAELFVDERLEVWKDWLRYHAISSEAPYLSSDIVEANFDFYGRTLTGAPEMRERWKRAVSLIEGALGEAVGKIYVERHFPPAAKSSMDGLVAHLIEAYRQSIATLSWMSEETRVRALEKLEAFTPKIGFPAKWRDYEPLGISATDLIANVRAVRAFEFDLELAKIGSPVNRDEWFMTPQTINAYYNPGMNEIVFPAAILQPPFFDVSRDAAENFGAIGAVIGHEIGHGFDDQGSKFDGSGRLTDWWQPSDREAFEELTKSLIDQYNVLAPKETPELHVNGALTIGENIGDLGGLGIAWKAYLISLDGQEPPTIDGLSGAERFFLAWAHAWQYQARIEETTRLLAIDPHSPPQFRCNQIVRNLDVFYDAFNVNAGDALWLDASERVEIW